MATARGRVSKVRFRGTPFGLSAVLDTPSRTTEPLPVHVAVPESQGGPIDTVAYVGDDARIARLTLPRTTPPGRYDGTLSVDGEERAMEVEVDAEADVRVFPEQLILYAHPGDLVGVDLTVLNLGNVPVEIRRVHAFGVFMEGGVERAIRKAYVAKLGKSQRRVDVLADTLAASHGGLVKLKITKGAGEVAPDGACDLEATLEIPGGVRPGSTYSGNWEIHNLVYPVKIVVGEQGEPDEREDEDQEHPEESSK